MKKLYWCITTISSLLNGVEEMAVQQNLTTAEQAVYRGFKTRKRQVEWLAGRIAVKQLYIKLSHNRYNPLDLSVAREGTGAPYLIEGDIRTSGRISISHTAGCVVVLLTKSELRIGIDLEEVSSREPAFITDYFTPMEQNYIRGNQPLTMEFRANLLWSAKESVLKAISTGLGVDPLRVEIDGVNVRQTMNGWTGLKAISKVDEDPVSWIVYYRDRINTVLTMCVQDSGELIELVEVDLREEDQRGK